MAPDQFSTQDPAKQHPNDLSGEQLPHPGRAPGELVLHRATSGAFVSYMREFFGEGAAYVTGWMYRLNSALTGIAELSAVGLYMQYRFPDLPA
jgi:L-asparagine transporter-like permease